MESIKTRFFGRKTLIEDIVQGVLAPNQPLDFSLVGPKMIGKSRLLSYLSAEDGPLTGPDPCGWRPERFSEGRNVITALYNCDWPAAQANLPQFILQRLRGQLEHKKELGLNWSLVERAGSPGQQIGQIIRQLEQKQVRLVLMLDNFDQVLHSSSVTLDTVNELRPLTNELGLIVASEQPLHDINQSLAASPLFSVMHQHFVGLLEPEAVGEWLEAYGQRFLWTPPVGQTLLSLGGNHPFLLARINDILLEMQTLAGSETVIDVERLPLIRLRLAEHARPLFEMLWRKLNEVKIPAVLPLLQDLVMTPGAIEQIPAEQTIALNWLINQAVVAYDRRTYRLFSPLFQEFLADQWGLESKSAPIWSTSPDPATGDETAIFDILTPKEAELLRYFQAHSYVTVSVDQLLIDVWNQPNASARRVQEAIRRLRHSLGKYSPLVGAIENERGVGYRYVPAPKSPAELR